MRTRPPSDWQRFSRCASTNDEAQRLARAGAQEGTVVVAAEQESGRGRLGRRWHSPRDENLYLSVVLRPELTPQKAPLLCLCAGLALHQAARTLIDETPYSRRADPPPRLQLKWPNDLLGARGGAPLRKLGGVLTELVCVGMKIDFVIVGVGCNVGGTEFPADIEATSLGLLTGLPPQVQVDRLGELFLGALADYYGRYLAHGARPIIESFSRAAELGPEHPPVIVKMPSPSHDPSHDPSPLAGIPVGLGPDGELLLKVESGALVTVRTGDVALAPAAAPTALQPSLRGPERLWNLRSGKKLSQGLD